LLLASFAGPKDNRAVEARPDVLVYSSRVLGDDLEIVGPVTALLKVRGSRPYHDVFVRLCDVEPAGRSVNVCDGLARVTPDSHRRDGDGWAEVSIELWPAAHRFRSGHRIRVQVSGGAHPRYARNPGTADPLATAVDLRPVEVEVAHGPSLVRLPGG
jgi:putative CocE/NonD family hydrolase